MKKASRLGLIGLWAFLATALLTRLWLTNPGAFPAVPEPLALWLVEWYGSRNGEELADLELLFGLALSFLVVTLATLGGWLAWRLVRNRSQSRTGI